MDHSASYILKNKNKQYNIYIYNDKKINKGDNIIIMHNLKYVFMYTFNFYLYIMKTYQEKIQITKFKLSLCTMSFLFQKRYDIYICFINKYIYLIYLSKKYLTHKK